MGCSLLDSIAIVHPLIISTLMTKVESAVKVVGEVSVFVCLFVCVCVWGGGGGGGIDKVHNNSLMQDISGNFVEMSTQFYLFSLFLCVYSRIASCCLKNFHYICGYLRHMTCT